MKLARICVLLAMFMTSASAASDALPDPAQESRAIAIGEELRCVVCQSESINDSQAEMARDLRLLVREKIAQGWTDQQVLDFAQARYGDFILLKPPFQMNTYVLWALPLGVFAFGGGLVWLLFRRRK